MSNNSNSNNNSRRLEYHESDHTLRVISRPSGRWVAQRRIAMAELDNRRDVDCWRDLNRETDKVTAKRQMETAWITGKISATCLQGKQ